MINIAFTVVSLLVISVAIFTRDHSAGDFLKNENTLGEETTSSEVLADATESPTSTPSATILPTPSESPNASSSSTINPAKSNDWIYPNSSKVSEVDGKTTLTTSDEPKAVLEWYRGKIQSAKYHTTTMIETSKNVKYDIFDKIVAGNSKDEINIEIKRDNPDEAVTISVSVSASTSST